MAERFFGNQTTLVQGPNQKQTLERRVQGASVLRASRVVPNRPTTGRGGNDQDLLGPPVALLAAGSRIGSYVLHEVLGAGSTGAVYAASDKDGLRAVAIKVLHNVQASQLVAFKSEFRLALRVAHRNLLSPYELCADGERWFIVMERVDGPDFLTFVRDGDDHYDEGRLRDTLLQVVAGVEALHAAGIVHRDLKPANVLVGSDGSVRIVDFGLAVLRDAQAWHDEGGRIIGSPAYMAPEQVTGHPPNASADVYCLGVMLFEALTGRLPFQGASIHEILLNKLACDARDPRELAAGIPPDLAELSLRLLSRSSAARPTLPELSAALQHQPPRRGADGASRCPPRLIGRERELGLLAQAYEGLAQGVPGIVLVQGQSGVGKSALVTEACARFTRAGALVLRGACHLLESIPFKGFDGVVDALRSALRALPESRRARILPYDLRSAAAMFPVLRDLCPRTATPPEREAAVDRERAYKSLKELLRALSLERRLVIALDDAQWGDRDGASLLSYLLSDETAPPPILFLIVHREDERAQDDLLHELEALPSRLQRSLQRVVVHPLTHPQAIEFASTLLETASSEQAQRIAQEAAGDPFLVEQLAHHATDAHGPLRLYDVITARAEQLDPCALRLLQLSATAGQPLPQTLLESCLELSNARPLVSQLVSLSLLRRTGAASDSLVYPYHDRIRDVLADALDERERTRLHLMLARRGEESGLLSASALVEHFTLGAAPERALPHALTAAQQAEATLAFDLAADMYARALALSDTLGLPGRSALIGRARSLHLAGRCAEAGDAFLRAARSTRGIERKRLESSAIEAWLACGRLGSALEVLRPLLRSIGSSYPEDMRGVLFSLLYGIAHAKLALRARPAVGPSGGNDDSNLRADLLWAAGKGLMPVATPQAAVLCFGSLRAALAGGDPHRVGRTLAFVGSGFVPLLAKQGPRCLAWARGLAEAQRDEHLQIMVHVAEAAQLFLSGSWSGTIERCERVLALTGQCSAPTAWEQSVAHTLLVSGHEYRGSLRDMEECSLRCLRSSKSRGDQITAVTVVSAYGYVRAARHDRAGVEQAIRDMSEAMKDWTVDFGVWDFYKLRLQVLMELCWGGLDSARALLDTAWSELKRRHLLHTPIVRGPALVLRLSVLLGQLLAGGALRPGLLREVLMLCLTLSREARADARVHALVARAALAWSTRQRARCDRLLARAEDQAREADLRVVSRMIGRQRAILAGRESDRVQCEAELEQRGVTDAAAWALYLVPGFSPAAGGRG